MEMDHGLMQGMFWGGLLMMSIPVLLGVGIGVFVLHRYWVAWTDTGATPLRNGAPATPGTTTAMRTGEPATRTSPERRPTRR